MKLGIIGLGKMGGNIALQCTEKGIKVVGKAREPKPELTEKGVKVVEEYKDFVSSLRRPMVIFLSLLAGPTIDNVINELFMYIRLSNKTPKIAIFYANTLRFKSENRYT